MFGQFEATVWPSSIFTMVLEGSHSTSNVLIVYAIALFTKRFCTLWLTYSAASSLGA
jgi:hypothetical protein